MQQGQAYWGSYAKAIACCGVAPSSSPLASRGVGSLFHFRVMMMGSRRVRLRGVNTERIQVRNLSQRLHAGTTRAFWIGALTLPSPHDVCGVRSAQAHQFLMHHANSAWQPGSHCPLRVRLRPIDALSSAGYQALQDTEPFLASTKCILGSEYHCEWRRTCPLISICAWSAVFGRTGSQRGFGESDPASIRAALCNRDATRDPTDMHGRRSCALCVVVSGTAVSAGSLGHRRRTIQRPRWSALGTTVVAAPVVILRAYRGRVVAQERPGFFRVPQCPPLADLTNKCFSRSFLFCPKMGLSEDMQDLIIHYTGRHTHFRLLLTTTLGTGYSTGYAHQNTIRHSTMTRACAPGTMRRS